MAKPSIKETITSAASGESGNSVSISETDEAFDRLIGDIEKRLKKESEEVKTNIIRALRLRYQEMRKLPILQQMKELFESSDQRAVQQEIIIYTVINEVIERMDKLKRKFQLPTVNTVGSTRQRRHVQRAMHRLQRYLSKVQAEIKKESEKEIGLEEVDEDDPSNPLLRIERLERTAMLIWKKMKNLSPKFASTGRHDVEQKTAYNDSGYSVIDQKITKLISGPARDSKYSHATNSRVLHPSVKFAMPSFHEVLDVVHAENAAQSLGIEDEKQLAQKIHRDVGLRLKYKDVMDRRLFMADLVRGVYGSDIEDDNSLNNSADDESERPCCSKVLCASEKFVKSVARDVESCVASAFDTVTNKESEESISSTSKSTIAAGLTKVKEEVEETKEADTTSHAQSTESPVVDTLNLKESMECDTTTSSPSSVPLATVEHQPLEETVSKRLIENYGGFIKMPKLEPVVSVVPSSPAVVRRQTMSSFSSSAESNLNTHHSFHIAPERWTNHVPHPPPKLNSLNALFQKTECVNNQAVVNTSVELAAVMSPAIPKICGERMHTYSGNAVSNGDAFTMTFQVCSGPLSRSFKPNVQGLKKNRSAIEVIDLTCDSDEENDR
ncbi:unnamed protein product [Soboliphyme baturini]|uniref:Serine/threonine-protein phosphatase n=1 Tax=Soboliphyme baturini TaxID=241478 RepID=A0A183IFL9_9BILA|nr:unnamed protein product [Soboliphyme baturini]